MLFTSFPSLSSIGTSLATTVYRRPGFGIGAEKQATWRSMVGSVRSGKTNPRPPLVTALENPH
jgi:hypothetical protein